MMIAGGAEKMQAQFLGPTYNYAKNIKLHQMIWE